MRFLVDAQLPRRLADWLSNHGHDAVHTLDLPNGNRTTDDQIRQLADQDQRVVITKDADFVSSHELQSTPEKLLLISTGNLSNNELLAIWERNHDQIESALSDARFVELRSDNLIVRG